MIQTDDIFIRQNYAVEFMKINRHILWPLSRCITKIAHGSFLLFLEYLTVFFVFRNFSLHPRDLQIFFFSMCI